MCALSICARTSNTVVCAVCVTFRKVALRCPCEHFALCMKCARGMKAQTPLCPPGEVRLHETYTVDSKCLQNKAFPLLFQSNQNGHDHRSAQMLAIMLYLNKQCLICDDTRWMLAEDVFKEGKRINLEVFGEDSDWSSTDFTDSEEEEEENQT